MAGEVLRCPKCSHPLSSVRDAAIRAPVYLGEDGELFVKTEEIKVTNTFNEEATLECLECFINFPLSEASSGKKLLTMNKLWIEKHENLSDITTGEF